MVAYKATAHADSPTATIMKASFWMVKDADKAFSSAPTVSSSMENGGIINFASTVSKTIHPQRSLFWLLKILIRMMTHT